MSIAFGVAAVVSLVISGMAKNNFVSGGAFACVFLFGALAVANV